MLFRLIPPDYTGNFFSPKSIVLTYELLQRITKIGYPNRVLAVQTFCQKRLLEAKNMTSALKSPHPRYHLFWLGVAPYSQSKGKGTLLLKAFFSMKREYPTWCLYLEAPNDRTAVFYQRFGYRELDKVEWRNHPIRSMKLDL